MTSRAVHWHEGMFLRPHHFQAMHRYQIQQMHWNQQWTQHYNWGLRSIDIDRDALSNFRFVVGGLRARLRDGTVISIPEDGVLPPLDLKPAFEKSNNVTIYLAVPVLNLGKANAADNGQADGARYKLDTQELEDENTGVNPQPLAVRLLNLKLLFATADHTGFEVMPIAQVTKSLRAEATPEINKAYIPPVVADDAWRPLEDDILHAVCDRVGKKIEVLSSQVTSRGITFDSHNQGDSLIFAQLRELNEAYALLQVMAYAQGVHPLTSYLELCRLVGQLSIFDAARRTPDLPRYDHDDLGGCFWRVKQLIDALLDNLLEPEYRERPFIGAGLRMQVALESAWVENWHMFIGVLSSLNPEETIRLLTHPGMLDMKIGSSDRVDTIFRMGQAGLRFEHAPRPPRALPALANLIYFQVSRDSNQLEWQNMQKSLTLAVRLNENRIVGNIQGQRILTIKIGQQTSTLQFTLYVVPQV
ncbi:MAG: type VI secretion system baseplate subunit TssK [Planctomycetia bacterium]|nr:type VI secretion system baseplate subunit TssK [Planctomycetia bacterium]